MIKMISNFITKYSENISAYLMVFLMCFLASLLALNVTGCATAKKLFPEATTEAESAAPEVRQAADKKAAKTIRKGKEEAVEGLEKL